MRWLCALALLLMASSARAVDAGPPAGRDDVVPIELRTFCDKRATCDASVAAADCVHDAPNLPRIARVGDATCTKLHDAILARYTCQSALSCEQLSDPANASCAQATNTIADLVLTGAEVCLQGRVPIDVPPTWQCNEFFFAGGTSDGCDCGCGAIDPDCGGGGCAEEGCFEAACTYCYVGGSDAGCTPSSSESEGSGVVVTATPTSTSSCQQSSWSIAGGAAVLLLLRARRRASAQRGSAC